MRLIAQYPLTGGLDSMLGYLFQLFGGLLVNIDSIWVGIRWLEYFSIFKYSMNVSTPLATLFTCSAKLSLVPGRCPAVV